MQAFWPKKKKRKQFLLLLFRCEPNPTRDNRMQSHLEADAQPSSAHNSGHLPLCGDLRTWQICWSMTHLSGRPQHCEPSAVQVCVIREVQPAGSRWLCCAGWHQTPPSLWVPPLAVVVPGLSLQVQLRAQRHGSALTSCCQAVSTVTALPRHSALHSGEGLGCCCSLCHPVAGLCCTAGGHLVPGQGPLTCPTAAHSCTCKPSCS